MYPKVSRFDFYTADDPNLLQYIAESGDICEDLDLNETQKEFLKRQGIALFNIINFDFLLEEYLPANWFIEGRYQRFDIDSVIDLLKIHKQYNTISEIEKFYQLGKDHQREIEIIAKYEDGWDEEMAALNDKINKDINFYKIDHSISAIAQHIRHNPDQYCRDENGKHHITEFSGSLIHTSKKGIKLAEYSVLNGRTHGECLEYDRFTGRPYVLRQYENGRPIRTIKSWDKHGKEILY